MCSAASDAQPPGTPGEESADQVLAGIEIERLPEEELAAIRASLVTWFNHYFGDGPPPEFDPPDFSDVEEV